MARSVDDFVIDFSKEEKTGGGGIRVKPGTYRVKIIKAVPSVSAEKETPGLSLTLKFLSGPKKGKTFVETLYATPKAYRRFRSLLEALGKKVPSKINLKRIASAVTGEELFVEMDNEKPREGYPTRSRVTFEGFMSEEDVDDEDGDDDEDEVDDEDDDLDEEDDDTDDEEEDEEDDEEDEPEPPKRRRRSAAKKAPAKKRRRRPADDDDDEDDDLDLEDL